MLLAWLFIASALALGLTPCQKGRCRAHGRCDPVTDQCTCNPGFEGPQCQYTDCNGHGHMLITDQHCTCRLGWIGDACDRCAPNAKGMYHVCLATSKHTGHPYMLTYVPETQFHEIMSGALRLDIEATHRSITPNSVGYDGRTYDCECRPTGERTENGMVPHGGSLRRHPKARDLNDAQATAYEMLVNQCVADAMFDAQTAMAYNEFTMECLAARNAFNGWQLAALLLAMVVTVLLFLTIWYGVHYCKKVDEFQRLRLGIADGTLNQPFPGQVPPGYTPVKASMSRTLQGNGLFVEQLLKHE